MASSVLAIVASLIGLIIWWVKRNAEKKADPKAQNEERYKKAEQDIAAGDGTDAGVHGADDLDELDRLHHYKGDQCGSNTFPHE